MMNNPPSTPPIAPPMNGRAGRGLGLTDWMVTCSSEAPDAMSPNETVVELGNHVVSGPSGSFVIEVMNESVEELELVGGLIYLSMVVVSRWVGRTLAVQSQYT